MQTRTLLAIVSLAGLAACGGGDLLAPPMAAEVYTLRSFNGGLLPARLSADADGEVALVDDSFQLFAGGQYLESGHLRTTRNGIATIQTLSSPGTYSRAGSTITLVSSSGTISGSFTDTRTLTILAGSNTLVFRR